MRATLALNGLMSKKKLIHYCLFYLYGTKYLKMDQVEFVVKHHFKFFKGSRPQILLGSFLNTLSHIYVRWQQWRIL